MDIILKIYNIYTMVTRLMAIKNNNIHTNGDVNVMWMATKKNLVCAVGLSVECINYIH